MMNIKENFIGLPPLLIDEKRVKLTLIPTKVTIELLEEPIKSYFLFFFFLAFVTFMIFKLHLQLQFVFLIWIVIFVIVASYIFIRDISLTNRILHFEADNITIISDSTFSFILSKTASDHYNFLDSSININDLVSVAKKSRISRIRYVYRVYLNLNKGRRIILGDFSDLDFVDELINSLSKQYNLEK